MRIALIHGLFEWAAILVGGRLYLRSSSISLDRLSNKEAIEEAAESLNDSAVYLDAESLSTA
jgi:hypothetical protein